MARECLVDVDAFTDEMIAQGVLKGRLRPAFIPIHGKNLKLRREFGWE